MSGWLGCMWRRKSTQDIFIERNFAGERENFDGSLGLYAAYCHHNLQFEAQINGIDGILQWFYVVGSLPSIVPEPMCLFFCK